MTTTSVPSWPDDATVPRWATRRDGQLRRPTRYRIVEDTRTSDRFHIALYNDGFRQHLVIITEPGEHTEIPAWRRTARDVVGTYVQAWPFGYSEFRATVRYHLDSEGLVESRQD